jgi:hypothetical protein
MPRIFDKNATGEVKGLLEELIQPNTPSNRYADVMYNLGEQFGKILLSEIKAEAAVAVACTVEDADFLAKGIIDVLETTKVKVALNVFWNKRFKPNADNRISIAPIIKEFHEPGYNKTDTLIIVKSIISSSCVVRTNLTRLIELTDPKVIFVVAPVLLKGSIDNLEGEFDKKISQRFQYLYFAEDDERTKDGIVLPGIGGDVYKRLGFEGQESKNRIIPQIVKQRRSLSVG